MMKAELIAIRFVGVLLLAVPSPTIFLINVQLGTEDVWDDSVLQVLHVWHEDVRKIGQSVSRTSGGVDQPGSGWSLACYHRAAEGLSSRFHLHGDGIA
jgi:hypothetical protein